MRYFNVKTGNQTGKFIDENTTIPSTDDRVKVFFETIDKIKYDRAYDVNGFPILKEYELKPDGTRYSAYLDVIGGDGKYHPDTDKITEAEELKLAQELKIAREKAKELLVISHNTVQYDGDFSSINYMSAVLAVANFKFNQAIGSGVDPALAYQAVYKDTLVKWKGATNAIHTVEGESIGETLEKIMVEIANIIGAK